MSNIRNQPQHAEGRARVEITPPSIVVTVADGREIGFAIGALNAAGFKISDASPGRVVVRVAHSRVRSVAKALEASGFGVDIGDPITNEES